MKLIKRQLVWKLTIVLCLFTVSYSCDCKNEKDNVLDAADQEPDCDMFFPTEQCNGIDDNCNGRVDEGVFGIIRGPILICEDCRAYAKSSAALTWIFLILLFFSAPL